MTEKTIQPYNNIPFLPLENEEQSTRHGAHFFRNVKQLQVGFGSKVFRVDRDGMWAGAEDFASAPWSVDWDGNMIANSITLSGYIATGGAAADVNAGATTISGGKITANSITADRLTVSTLSAISANLGTITAGSISAVSISGSTITGSTLSTATSGQRVVLFSTLASYYNSSGTLVCSTYASGTSFWIKGEQSSTDIWLDAGASGVTAFLFGGSIRAIFDYGSRVFYPTTAIDLGGSGFNWRDLYHNGEEVYQGMTQPVIYHGRVDSGSIVDDNFVPWSVNNSSTGIYVITHNFGHLDYTVQVTPRASTVKNITVSSHSSNSFTVRIANLSDVLEDNDFYFTVCEFPQ